MASNDNTSFQKTSVALQENNIMLEGLFFNQHVLKPSGIFSNAFSGTNEGICCDLFHNKC